MSIRVRFAPSPTGYLHVGGLRTALYNYLFAKQNNGQIILRIEDTDQSRRVEGAVEKITSIFDEVGIKFNEGPKMGGEFGPYSQSQRLDIYKDHVQTLIDKDMAYPCLCTSERLSELRKEREFKKLSTKYDRHCLNLSTEEIQSKMENESYVIRLKVPDDKIISLQDIVRGEVQFNTNEIDDQVLLKSDGFPTYHLANVVDDHLMKISHVIRGEEWLSSTPKHIILYQTFGWEIPQFAHLPLLLNADRSKLSKRQGDVSVENFLHKGILSDSLLNFLALLGWNPGTDQEIFSLQELINEFSLDRIQKGGAVFDYEKLNWMNGRYLKSLPLVSILDIVKESINNSEYDFSNHEKFSKVIDFARNRVSKWTDILNESKYFYEHDPQSHAESKLLDESKSQELYSFWYSQISSKENWSAEEIKNLVSLSSTQIGLNGKDLFSPLRLAVYGDCKGPDIPTIYDILGREEFMKRLKSVIEVA